MRAPRRRYAFAAAESNLRRGLRARRGHALTTEDDLAAAVHTASIHTAPGGVAIFAPDFVREALRNDRSDRRRGRQPRDALPGVDVGSGSSDTTYVVDYSYLLGKARRSRPS